MARGSRARVRESRKVTVGEWASPDHAHLYVTRGELVALLNRVEETRHRETLRGRLEGAGRRLLARLRRPLGQPEPAA